MAASRRPSIVVLLLLAAISVAALAAIGYYIWMQTPHYAVRQVLAAQEAGDVAQFERYVDMQLLTDQLLVLADARIDDALSGAVDAGGKWTGGIRALAERARGQIRDQLRTYVTSAITDQVADGRFSWHTLAVLQRGQIDELKDWILEGSDATFIGVGEITSTQKTAQAVLQYQVADDEAEAVTLILQRSTSGWQVVAVKQLP